AAVTVAIATRWRRLRNCYLGTLRMCSESRHYGDKHEETQAKLNFLTLGKIGKSRQGVPDGGDAGAKTAPSGQRRGGSRVHGARRPWECLISARRGVSPRSCDRADPSRHPSSDSTLEAWLLAMASVEVPACWRIWARVSFDVSSAKSVSRIWLSEAVRFS